MERCPRCGFFLNYRAKPAGGREGKNVFALETAPLKVYGALAQEIKNSKRKKNQNGLRVGEYERPPA